MPTRSFGIVDNKICEAEFFLYEVKRHADDSNMEPLSFCLSAFLAATRSVTFAMQASLNDHADFAAWYAVQQERLRADQLVSFFNKARTYSQHIGAGLVGGGTFRKGKSTYYFAAREDLPNTPELDIVTACEKYFLTILELVFKCYTDHASIVNAQHRFTAEYFASRGQTIEDAEEELGMSRGYTRLAPPFTDADRWRFLRRQADGCPISEQFERWLGKGLSHPDDESDASPPEP